MGEEMTGAGLGKTAAGAMSVVTFKGCLFLP